MKQITVIGFGKIGQAVAANLLQHGFAVMAVDTDPSIAQSFEDNNYATNEPGVHAILHGAYTARRLQIVAETPSVEGMIAVIVAIPLIVDQQHRLLDRPFLEAMTQLAPRLASNIPVIIETSVPVGFSRNHVLPALEAQGKMHGRDFLLANSPERIKSGTMLEQLRLIPKVIGGISPEAAASAMEVYAQFFDSTLLHIVDSIEAAEFVKLAGMIYRDVNIALSNQLAQFADATDIPFADLLPLINTDREANLLQPGIGVGGHCTPVYPYFLIHNFSEKGLDFGLARQSRVVNDEMAAYAVSLINHTVLHKKAMILGLSFRPNVKEDALSTTYLLVDELRRNGFETLVHDVEFSAEEIAHRGLRPVADIYAEGVEAIFLVTMHREYAALDFERLAMNKLRYFVDGRNSIDRSKVEQAGIRYFGIGR